jgi:hypothetical protein
VDRILARRNPALLMYIKRTGILTSISRRTSHLTLFALQPVQRLVDIRKCARWIPMDGQIAHLTYRKPPVSLLVDSGVSTADSKEVYCEVTHTVV